MNCQQFPIHIYAACRGDKQHSVGDIKEGASVKVAGKIQGAGHTSEGDSQQSPNQDNTVNE